MVVERTLNGKPVLGATTLQTNVEAVMAKYTQHISFCIFFLAPL